MSDLWWLNERIKCGCGAEADPHWGKCYDCFNRNYENDGGLRANLVEEFRQQSIEFNKKMQNNKKKAWQKNKKILKYV